MSGNIIDMCDYIATVNTNDAVALCEKYDYSVDDSNPQHISDTMIEICSSNGADALKKVLAIHPDKQAILDAFNARIPQSKYNACGGCQGAINPALSGYNRYQSFYAADGAGSNASTNTATQQGTFANMISMQTNTILVIGLLVIGGALIYKNFK
jgi:hypothetical protein